MLKFKANLSGADKTIKRLERQLRVGTARAAQQASVVGQVKQRAYLMAFIYDHPESPLYQRTEQALNGLGMSLTPAEGGFLLTLRSDAPYAAQLEQGNELDYFAEQAGGAHIPQISAEELALLMDNMAEMNGGDPAPGTLMKRRGPVNYQEPAPHVTPAAVAAMYEFEQRLRALWTEAGR